MARDRDPARSRSYHHGNLRAELLDTAIAELAEGDAESLSLRALARRIGVSQTAPYRHFADKEALLAAMAVRGYRDLLETLRRAGEAAGAEPPEQLAAFAHAYVNYAADNPALFKLMFGPLLQPPEKFPALRDISRETFAVVQQILQRGIELGRFRGSDEVRYLANVADRLQEIGFRLDPSTNIWLRSKQLGILDVTTLEPIDDDDPFKPLDHEMGDV